MSYILLLMSIQYTLCGVQKGSPGAPGKAGSNGENGDPVSGSVFVLKNPTVTGSLHSRVILVILAHLVPLEFL